MWYCCRDGNLCHLMKYHRSHWVSYFINLFIFLKLKVVLKNFLQICFTAFWCHALILEKKTVRKKWWHQLFHEDLILAYTFLSYKKYPAIVPNFKFLAKFRIKVCFSIFFTRWWLQFWFYKNADLFWEKLYFLLWSV